MRRGPSSGENVQQPRSAIAACIALAAYAVALVAGWASGVPGPTVMLRALVAMVVCYAVGSVLASMAYHAIREFLDAYEKNHPVPELGRSPTPEHSEAGRNEHSGLAA